MRIETAIRRYVERELLRAGPIPGDPLTEGLLDSLAVEQLVAFIEEKYGVKLADEELAGVHAESIPALARLVRKKRSERRP